MAKNSREISITKVLIFTGLVAFFYIFNVVQVWADPGTVEFTADVILDLTNLATTTYINSGSKIDYLTIDGTGADANIYGIWDGIAFQLKTDSHSVLQLTTSGGTADLLFSSNDVDTEGYVSQWTATSSVSIDYVVGVSKTDTYYNVEVDGSPHVDSPFDSGPGPSPEVSFTHSGGGDYTIEEMNLAVETFSAIDITAEGATLGATLRGKLTERGEGDTVHVWFKWDTDQELLDPESTSEEEMVGLGIFRADISSLTEGQTYYFQAVAEEQSTGFLVGGEILSFVAREKLFITVTMGGKTRIIEIDRAGRIIIKEE